MLLGARGQEGIGHAPQFSRFDCFLEGGLDAFWESWQSDVEHVVLDTSVLGRCGRQVLGYIDKDASLVGADLVDENWWLVAEDDVTVVGHGQFRVNHLETPKLATDLGLVRVVFLPELGSIAVGD